MRQSVEIISHIDSNKKMEMIMPYLTLSVSRTFGLPDLRSTGLEPLYLYKKYSEIVVFVHLFSITFIWIIYDLLIKFLYSQDLVLFLFTIEIYIIIRFPTSVKKHFMMSLARITCKYSLCIWHATNQLLISPSWENAPLKTQYRLSTL